MGKIIGIDLGTTNSVVAVAEGTTPRVIADAEGRKTMPSVVARTASGELLVGHAAKRQAATNPLATIYSIKRFIGLRPAEVLEEMKRVSYTVEPRGVDDLAVRLGTDELSAPEVSAHVLRHLKEVAEADLGGAVTQAVITVPAYFNDAQRQATRKAGQLAGLEVERIINEPTAAALAYGLESQKNGTIAVYDLGGGTFDITILEIVDGVFEVRSTSGDTHLGGDDIDHRIMDWVAERVRAEHDVYLTADPSTRQRLREAAEAAKCALSDAEEAEIAMPFLQTAEGKVINVKETLKRTEFEQIAGDLVEQTRAPCLQALRDAELTPQDIDEVILVGGSTRIPMVRRLVADVFAREPHTDVDPDLAVGLGAAVQGGILAGDPFGAILLDVTPLSLGIEAFGGIMSKLISRNTTIPTSHREMYTTAVDNQTSVDIHVLQGEREMAADNRTLGRFQLTGLPPMPAGAPQIEITLTIDQNGILNVGAVEMRTGAEASIELKASADISDDEVDRMVREAIEKGKEDRAKAGLVEAKTQADQILRSIGKAMEDPELVPEGPERVALSEAIEAVEAALSEGVERKIREATAVLDHLADPVAERMMERVAAQRVAEGREE